ncbi:MAG: hypothetical protein JNK05_38785 [Myxococcales bacterium]|nr:hypothetical protein [Myxococcales bacterium]
MNSTDRSTTATLVDRALVLVAIVALVAAASRFGASADGDLQRAAVALAHQPADDLLGALANASIRASIRVFGASSLALRVPSLAATFASMLFVGLAARRWFGAPRAATASLVLASLPLTTAAMLHDTRASFATAALGLVFAIAPALDRRPAGLWIARGLVLACVAFGVRNSNAPSTLATTLEGLAHRSFPWVVAVLCALAASAEDRDDARASHRSLVVLALVAVLLAATRDGSTSTLSLAAVPCALLVASFDHSERPPTLQLLVALFVAAVIARDLSQFPQALRRLGAIAGSADARRDTVEPWLALAPWCAFALVVVGALVAKLQRTASLVAALVLIASNEEDFARQSAPRAALVAARDRGFATVAARIDPSQPALSLDAPANTDAIHSDDDAVRWLVEHESRGAMLVHRARWASINAFFRERFQRNLGFEGGHGSGWALASARAASEPRNPLFDIVSSAPPALDPGARRASLEPRPRFDDRVELAFVDVLREPASMMESSRFRVSLQLHGLDRVGADYRVFVHGDSACPRINVDHEPAQGRYPTGLWRAGDWVRDAFVVAVPWHCDARSVRVYVGLFRGDARARVSVGAHDGADRVLATTLVLAP